MIIASSELPNTDIICPDAITVCDVADSCCISIDGDYSCCPIQNAVCCDDHIHCCPEHYKCDLKIFKCDRQLAGELFQIAASKMKKGKKINSNERH